MATGSYAINATPLNIQPETGRWLPRDVLGIDGNGHAIYSAYREFEMSWGFMTKEEFNQLLTFHNSVGLTGTAVVELPQYDGDTYTHYPYSGCVLREPEAGEYFEQRVTDVRYLVVKIKT